MTDTIKKQLEWQEEARRKYDTMVAKLPLFHREIAKQVVNKKAEVNAQERGGNVVEEGDIVQAFLTEVPKPFYSLMIRLMDEVKFDYKKYEG